MADGYDAWMGTTSNGMNRNLAETNKMLSDAVKLLKYMADNTKELEKNQENVNKKLKLNLRTVAKLAKTGKDNPLGEIGGRGWMAIRQISAKVLPGFWRLQSTITGIMNTIETLYLIGDKMQKGESKGVLNRMKEIEQSYKKKH